MCKSDFAGLEIHTLQSYATLNIAHAFYDVDPLLAGVMRINV